MKPLIGISSNEKEDEIYVKEHYIEKVLQAGGIPVVITSHLKEDVEALCERLDGVILTGGGDVDPSYFNEEPNRYLGTITPNRDTFELGMAEELLRVDKPVLGVCRGMQLLNVAIGGDMYQDIYDQADGELIQHDQKAPATYRSHHVYVEAGSLLCELVEEEKLRVNSYHHQAVREVPAPFKVSAVSTDGIIEAIESTKHRFVLGLQWHPERLDGSDSDAIFKKLIEESRA